MSERLGAKRAWGRLAALARELQARQHSQTHGGDRALRMAWGLASPEAFNATYLSHYFRAHPAPFHSQLYEALETYAQVVVRAPRGHAKSTVITFAYPLHQIACARYLRAFEEGGLAGVAALDAPVGEALRRVLSELAAQGRTPSLCWDPFIQIVAVTGDTAEEFTASIKVALEMNEALIADWGVDGRLVDQEGKNYHDFVSATDVRCRAYGMNTAIRGAKHGAWRPTLALVDDPDSRATVGSPKVRDKQMRQVMSALRFGLDPKKRRIFVVGTPLHWDCVVCRLTDPGRYPDWHKLRFSARQPDGSPLWPEVWSLEALNAEERNNPEEAGPELFDAPPDDGQRVFPAELLRYRRDELPRGTTVLFLDPSLARSESSDLQGLVGIRMAAGNAFVLSAEGLRLAPQDLIRHVAAKARELSADAVGVETISAQELFLLLLDPADQATIGPWHRIDSHAEGKLPRIRGLGPWLRSRLFFPDDGSCALLERHLRSFPDCPLDVLDALEMALRLALHLNTGTDLRITARLPGRAAELREGGAANDGFRMSADWDLDDYPRLRAVRRDW